MGDRKDVKKTEITPKTSQDSEEYSFIKETIKNKPLNRKLMLTRIVFIIAGAVLFGVVAAFVFAGAAPLVSQKIQDSQGPQKVDINVEEPQEEQEVTTIPAPEVVEVPRSITLEDYSKIYEEVRQVAEEPLKSIVTVAGVAKGEDILDNSFVSSGQSAGVIIAMNDKEIYVLTGKKAISEDSEKVRVSLPGDAAAEGALQQMDSATGLAVVVIPAEDISEKVMKELEVASLGNSYSLMQGKPVIAIGSPSGYNEAVAYGSIVSVANKVSVADAEYNLLVTDILGSSEGSGVLLDTQGSVIGIIAQNFGDSKDTMVKALSVSQLKSLLSALSNGEDIKYMGVCGQDVTESIAKNTGIPQGIYVDSVESNSPAMEAGIQSADVITGFNGQEVTSMQRFSTELQKCKKDEKVIVKIMRRGNEGYVEMEFEITIGIK